MKTRVRLLARVAVFSALVFAACYAAVFLPNVNPCFFVVFTAGFFWGVGPGVTVGVVGFFLWSTFNPYGPVALPLLVSQLIGIAFSGLIGVMVRKILSQPSWNAKTIILLSLAGLGCGLMYHLVVDVGQQQYYHRH